MWKYKRREKYRSVKKILCMSLCLLFGLLTAFSSFAFAPDDVFSNDETSGILIDRPIDVLKYNEDIISSDLPETEETESSLPENSESPEETESSDISEPESSDPDASEDEQPPISSRAMFNITVSTFDQLKSNMESAGDRTIILTADITLTDTIIVPSGANIVLKSSGLTNRTLFMDSGVSNLRHFRLNGGSVNVESTVTLDGQQIAGGVEVKAGTFTLGGVITKCRTSYAGGAIEVTGGSLLLEGGGISNCVATRFGGGIYYGSAANVEMKGTTISGCIAHSGAGIYIDNQATEFTLGQDAAITACTTEMDWSTSVSDTPNGAGVSVKAGTLSMRSNSKITDCISASHAGGIHVSEGAAVIIGAAGSASDTPLIKGCKSTRPDSGEFNGGNGGAIRSAGTVYMYSGSIEDCTSAVNGGGIYLSSSANFNMAGGSILNCASGHAGGVFVSSSSSFNMSAGTIDGCTSVSYGGGVSITGGTMTMVKTGLSAPIIRNCFSGGSGADWWGGKGGGIAVLYSGSLEINGGLIDACTASANGDYRIVGSGGGIFLDESSRADVVNATISNCTASFYGGGICTLDYANLTTTTDVSFTGNKACFSRKPADDVTQYGCSSAKSISPTGAELGSGILCPLNNYDINYLSCSVIYDGNGGTDGGITAHEIVKEIKPFVKNDEGLYIIPDSFTDTYTVLDNNWSANNLFEYSKSGSDFGVWGTSEVYIPDIQYFTEYPPGSTVYIGRYMLLDSPELKLHALWTKDITVTKNVVGAYGDLTKDFYITVKLVGAWGESSYSYTETFSLAHGESATIDNVYESSIMYVSEAPAEGYTVNFSSRAAGDTGSDSINDWVTTIANLYEDRPANVYVTNTYATAVDSGVSFTNMQTALVLVGAFGVVLTSCLVVHASRKRRGN